jgi:uncharacterized membrane protein
MRLKMNARAALAGFAAIAAMIGAVRQAEAATNLTMCNKTGAKIYIATVSYEERTKKWMLSAWHARNPGECKSMGAMHTGMMYYFAEKQGGKEYWPARDKVERSYCVPPGKVQRVMLGGSCPQGERLLGFRSINLTGATYTFTFNN